MTLCLFGGAVGMGGGMLLSQIAAVAVFYGLVLIVKGSRSIPYMLEDDPDYKKVHMYSFDYTPEEYERLRSWVRDKLAEQGIGERSIEETTDLLHALFIKTEEKGGKKTILGECVIRFTDKPEITVKDNGELSEPDIEDERLSYNVLMSRNSNTIRIA